MDDFKFKCSGLCIEAVPIVAKCNICKKESTNYFKTVRIDFYQDCIRECGTIYCNICKSLLHFHHRFVEYEYCKETYFSYIKAREKVFNSPYLRDKLNSHDRISWTHIIELQLGESESKKGDVFLLSCEDCKTIITVKTIKDLPIPISENNIDCISYQSIYHFDKYGM